MILLIILLIFYNKTNNDYNNTNNYTYIHFDSNRKGPQDMIEVIESSVLRPAFAFTHINANENEQSKMNKVVHVYQSCFLIKVLFNKCTKILSLIKC